MNNSTKENFKTLSQEDKKIAFDTLVEDQAITYDYLMNAAHKEAGDNSAADKIITAMIENATEARATHSKRQKKTPTYPHVTPNRDDRASANSPRKSTAKKTLFNTDKEYLLRQTDSESDDDFDDDDYIPSTTVDAKTKGNSGIEKLTLAKTYAKLGWPNTCNVICTINPGRSSNPTRCLITLAKLMKIDLDEAEIKRIKYISDIERFSLARVLTWFNTVGIIVEEKNLEFEELFRSDTKSKDMILIVTINDINKTHESHLTDNPQRNKYAMLSIIIPSKRHLMLTFNSTNTNLCFGSRIHKREWGVVSGSDIRETCKGYMSKNMYQKMDPIFNKEDGHLVGSSIRRKVKVEFTYTIKNSAAAYMPAAHKQS